MFVGGQYFSGSLERNVFGNVIGIILINNEKRVSLDSWEIISCRARVTYESHEHWSPTNNDDSTISDTHQQG